MLCICKREFWYTPAYTTNSIDADSPKTLRKQLKDSTIKTITELSKMTSSEVDNEIKSIIDERTQEILNSDAVPTNEFIQQAKKYSSSYIDDLNK